MSKLMEVRGHMFIRGGIAAECFTTGLACPEMNPPAASLHAFGALMHFLLFYLGDFPDMGADIVFFHF